MEKAFHYLGIQGTQFSRRDFSGTIYDIEFLGIKNDSIYYKGYYTAKDVPVRCAQINVMGSIREMIYFEEDSPHHYKAFNSFWLHYAYFKEQLIQEGAKLTAEKVEQLESEIYKQNQTMKTQYAPGGIYKGGGVFTSGAANGILLYIYPNTSDKDIEYLDIQYDIVNSVGDRIGTASTRGTGPLPSGKTGKFVSQTRRRISGDLKPRSIKVTFMDGSSILLSGKNLMIEKIGLSYFDLGEDGPPAFWTTW